MSLTIISSGSIDTNLLQKISNGDENDRVLKHCAERRAEARSGNNGYSSDKQMQGISKIPNDIYWSRLAVKYVKECMRNHEAVDFNTFCRLKDMDLRLKDIFHNPDPIERRIKTDKFLSGDFKKFACVDKL